MRRVKVPGLDIQVPSGSAFKIETPPMMPKMHLLAAVVAPRGYGKGVITTNLIEQLKVVDRLVLVSPSDHRVQYVVGECQDGLFG